MKKSEGDRLKYAVCKSTLSTAARSPFPEGEGKEEAASSPQKEANPASLRSAAPSYGRRCPEGAEVEWGKRDEKDRERSSQVRRLREHPSAAARSPFPNGEGCDMRIPIFSTQRLSLRGKAKRRRLCRPKRKATPPRCARQPLPREGARVDTPSFLWKEVPRRGGGWMGEAG